MTGDILREYFPSIKDPALREEIEHSSRLIDAEEGDVLLDYGAYSPFMPLLISGRIKVMRMDEEGDELLLYYLNPGETCAMTMNCCMSGRPSEVRAVAEEDSTFVAVPVAEMDRWMTEFANWREFVMMTFNSRFDELLRTIDDIAFKKLDERLLKYLEETAGEENKVVRITHQQIASDLHSSREVISRILKQLEKTGRIKLGRNRIELL